MGVCVVTLFGLRSITFEGNHEFHLYFTEGSSIIKYRQSSKGGGVIQNVLTELWPFSFLFFFCIVFVMP